MLCMTFFKAVVFVIEYMALIKMIIDSNTSYFTRYGAASEDVNTNSDLSKCLEVALKSSISSSCYDSTTLKKLLLGGLLS